MLRLVLVCGVMAACATNPPPDRGGDDTGGGDVDPVAACGDRVVAPGYPKVGAGCATHATVDTGTQLELASARGIGPIGSTLFGFGVRDHYDFNEITVPLPTLAPGTYHGGDCASLRLGPVLMSGYAGRATFHIDGNATAVWGDIDASACKPSEIILGEYDCVPVTGKFAALRETTPLACPTCPGPSVESSGCVLPIYTDNGSAADVCLLNTETCAALAPDLVGTYVGDTGYQGVDLKVTFAASGAVTAVELDGLVQDTPTGQQPVTFRATTFPPGSLTQQGAFFQVHVDAPSIPAISGIGKFELFFTNADKLTYDGQIVFEDGTPLALGGTLHH